jgi:hypothetical protein
VKYVLVETLLKRLIHEVDQEIWRQRRKISARKRFSKELGLEDTESQGVGALGAETDFGVGGAEGSVLQGRWERESVLLGEVADDSAAGEAGAEGGEQEQEHIRQGELGGLESAEEEAGHHSDSSHAKSQPVQSPLERIAFSKLQNGLISQEEYDQVVAGDRRQEQEQSHQEKLLAHATQMDDENQLMAPPTDSRKLLLDISRFLAEQPEMGKAMRKTRTVLQVAMLRDKQAGSGGGEGDSDRWLCVANTHLFYHPDAPHIRAAQAAMAMWEISAFVKKTKAKHVASGRQEPEIGVVLCGDLNAFPGSAAIDFLERGKVDADHQDWAAAASFKWNNKTKSGKPSTPKQQKQQAGVELVHDVRLKSAYGAYSTPEERAAEESARESSGRAGGSAASSGSGSGSGVGNGGRGHPAFTNFVQDFEGCLDYIFYADDVLEATALAALPSRSVVEEDVALPSPVFPSDHVSIAVDLRWRSANKE